MKTHRCSRAEALKKIKKRGHFAKECNKVAEDGDDNSDEEISDEEIQKPQAKGKSKQKSHRPLTDCAPAISILEALHSPKNSKNLLVQDRNVRAALSDGILSPVHVLSKEFATDLNANPSGPRDFLAKRAVLLNIKANPTFAMYL